MKVHPHDSLLREALGGTGKSFDKILEHLSSCAQCRERLTRLKPTQSQSRWCMKQEDYGPALNRSFSVFQLRQAALDEERIDAPELLGRLMALAPGRQQLLLKNSCRFKTWGLFELLIERGKEETFTDPWHAEDLLHLALEISEHLSPSSYGLELIADMRARAWGYIANSRRSRMDLYASEEAFKEASSHLRRGSGDPLERAILFDLQASLFRIQERVEESLQLSRRAVAVFRKMKQSHLLGRALIKSSIAYRLKRDPGRAVSLLYQSLDLIDQTYEPRLTLYALNNLADDLTAIGHFMEARKVLRRARPFYSRFPEKQNHLMWLEATVAYPLGRYVEAEIFFQKAHDGFISAKMPELADLISHELAALRAGSSTCHRQL